MAQQMACERPILTLIFFLARTIIKCEGKHMMYIHVCVLCMIIGNFPWHSGIGQCLVQKYLIKSRGVDELATLF